MKNIPHKLYLNFNKLSGISWNTEKIDDSDIEYLNGKTAFPVFDLLEEELDAGAYIGKQDDRWQLFNETGEGIVSGETIREMLIELIFYKH